MIGAIDWFGQIFGAVPDGGIEYNTNVAKAMIREGLAVVLIKPGEKLPACTLSARDGKKADEEAREAARESGNANWDRVRHECGVKHALTDIKELTHVGPKKLFADGCNLAVSLDHSTKPILIVDVDTEEEKKAFLDDWALAILDETPAEHVPDHTYPLTVRSPGVMNASMDGDEVWVHKDGGHFWFTLPEGVELPERAGKLTWCRCHGLRQPKGGCRRSWAVFYGSGYVLVPPSVRKEGPYRVTGQAPEAPAWLIEHIQTTIVETTKDPYDGPRFEDDPIDDWSANTSWSEILGEDGFTPHGIDACGCETYTKPGGAANPKSVTAHEVGCAQYSGDRGHNPIHIWTDAISGPSTQSKLSWIANQRFGSDMRAAMESLALTRLGGTVVAELDPFSPDQALCVPAQNAVAVDQAFTDPGGVDVVAAAGVEVIEGEIVDDTWASMDLSSYVDGTYVPEIPSLLPRTDGIGLLYPGKIHSFHGESESGKSLVLLWLAAQLIMDGEDVLWLDFDSDPGETVARLMRMGATPAAIMDYFDYRRPDVDPRQSDAAKAIMVRPYALAVLDGITDLIGLLGGSIKENDDFARLARVLLRPLADRTGAAVVLVDHVTKDSGNRGRYAIGGQSKMSVLTGAAYVVEVGEVFGRGMRGTIILRIGKDRPGGIRPNCGSWRALDRTQEAARVTVDDTGPSTVLTIEAPNAIDPFAVSDRPVKVIQDVIEYLRARTEPALKGELYKAIGGRAETLRETLELMEREGTITLTKGDKNKVWHSLNRTNHTPEIEA